MKTNKGSMNEIYLPMNLTSLNLLTHDDHVENNQYPCSIVHVDPANFKCF